MLSSSPRDVQSFLVEKDDDDDLRKDAPFLQTFLKQLPHAIRQRKDSNPNSKDPVTELFQTLQLHKTDWAPYFYIDPTRPYTRNLIATDNETYTLLLLCWNPQQASPIHDHPCDGCWMRVLQGRMREERYAATTAANKMHCTRNALYRTGELLFMQDSMGYHRVSNPSETELAVTMHLYCPPYHECKTWANEAQVEPTMSRIRHFTEYGRKV